MGRFRKGFKPKSGKVYDLSKTLKILKQEGFENYTTEEVAGGYMIINEAEIKEVEKQNRWKQKELFTR